MEFQRFPQKFVFTGINLNDPVDLMPPGKSPFAKNIRSYREGQVTSRAGLASINSSPVGANIHTIFRTNEYIDYLSSNFIRYIGAGTVLYAGTTSFSSVQTGFSGNPLSIVPYKPDQSSYVWSYIADSLQMKKVRNGTESRNMGIAPPITPPVAELLPPKYTIPGAFDSASGWANNGNAGAVTRATRNDGRASAVVYVSGSTGWACVGIGSLGTPGKYAVGQTVTIGGEQTVVEEIHKPAQAGAFSNTIASIAYDSGSTGLCTIQPSVPITGLRRNALVELGTLGEWVRIVSVTQGPDGIASFRCVTTGTATAGSSILLPVNGSLFVYLTGTHTSGAVVFAYEQDFAFASGGSQTGNIAYNTAYDFSVAGSRPITPDDYIQVGIKLSHPEKLIEGRVVLDIDPATGGTYAATDGQQNAYYKAFRTADFQGLTDYTQTSDALRSDAITQLQQDNTNLDLETTNQPFAPQSSGQDSTSIDISSLDLSNPEDLAKLQEIQSRILNNDPQLVYESPTTIVSKPPSQEPITPQIASAAQLITGDSQWTQFRWKIADLIRIGSDQSVTLADIKAIQFRFIVSDDVEVSVSNLWVGGTYGPDSGDIYAPLVYRARYRATGSGAKSLPGPALRSGIQALRQGVTLTLPASSDAQVDKIDIERYGGQANSWHYVGTCPNSSPTFVDDQTSSGVLVNPPLDTDAYQPFPVMDIPRSIVVNVVGSRVTRVSGDSFNTSWARGTQVIINGRATLLYSMPASSSVAYLQDSLGSQSSVTMEIPAPVITGYPLPVMWGPFYDTMFAVGNPLSPGTIYFTKPGEPDSAPDTNSFDIASPSEALMGGCMYDGKAYVWSDKRMFQIVPTGNPIQPFQYVEVPSGKGLFYRWGIAVGPRMWWIGSDGIYESVGGEAVCISGDIQSMFPQGDKTLTTFTNGAYPVNMSGSLRLAFHNNLLYFDFLDSNNNYHTFIYDIELKGWYYDEYFQGSGVHVHYSENGIVSSVETNNLVTARGGVLYVYSGTSDDSTAIQCELWTPAVNSGDPRAKKVYGDIVFDMNPNGLTITTSVWKNYFGTSIASTTYTGSSRVITDPLDLNSGSGYIIQNLGVKLSWSATAAGPELYYWEPSLLQRPEDTFLRATDWTDGGYGGSKLLRGFLVEADSESVARNVKLQGDQADLQTYTMTFAGQMLKAFSVNPTQIASLMRLLPTDVHAWRNFRVSYIFQKLAENASIITEFTNDGNPGAKFVQGMIVTALGGPATGTVEYDGGTTGATVTLNHPGSFPYGKPYSFPTPFIAHELRLNPDSPIRIEDVEWIWEPAPELTEYWITQETTHDLSGFQFPKDGYIAYISTADITFKVFVDGVEYDFTLPNSSGLYVKHYLILATGTHPLKGKVYKYSFSSAQPFRLFKKDCEIRVHQWDGGDYVIRQPFGGQSRLDGAKI